METEEIEIEVVVAGLIRAWREFKASHDLQDAKIACCAKTRGLFDRLDEFEERVVKS